MRNARIFLNQLQENKKSFLNHFKSDEVLKKVLFDQYLQTEEKANEFLYISQFISEDEHNNIIEEAQEKLPEGNRSFPMAGVVFHTPKETKLNQLSDEFHKLLKTNSLPKKYYSHNIRDTPIFINLELLSKNIEKFKNRILLPTEFNPSEYSETFTSKLFFLLEKIGIEKLTTLMLTSFLNDTTNFMIQSELIVGDEFDFQQKHKKSSEILLEYYHELKGYADMQITKYLNKMNKNEKLESNKKGESKKGATIPPKINALFNFIGFLHSNIDNFKQYDEIINELKVLDKKRNEVSPRMNYKDKIKYYEAQGLLAEKFKIIRQNILEPIRNKATELNICEIDETNTLWNWNISEINNLKENFSQKDLPEIIRHKKKYLEYRTETNGESYFELQFFFNDLDEILKVLFDYFKETDQNEFEAFETKTIEVNTINEAVKEFTKEKTGFIKLKISKLNIDIGESGTYKNMPVINQHYLPLINSLKKKTYNNEIPINEIKLYWQTLRNQIESDLYNIGKLYNDETIEFCKKRIFPLIDIEIKKAEQTFSPQQIIKPNQSKEIEFSNKKTKVEKLVENFKPYDFNKLETVIIKNDLEILQKIATSKLPFQIAYLDFLGFITHLNSNFCQSNKELHKLLAQILNVQERAVRGNINVLRNEKSTDRNRYTSYQHTENVKKHYDSIK